ncbi:MAG: polyprenol phosphomannose-dependent alpha 1,6 mannosyltransferase MptB [Actinomycetota bacterium]
MTQTKSAMKRASTSDGDRERFARLMQARLATAALLASAGGIALVASRPASAITPQLAPDAGPLRALAAAARFIGLDQVGTGFAAALSAALLVAAAAAFVYSLRLAWGGRLALRRILVVGVLLHAVVLVLPLLFSRDVYSYTAYGRIVSEYGRNPYVATPQEFPDDPIYPVVSRFWVDSPSVYGPAFSAAAAGVTSVAESPASSVVAFKTIAAIASAATMFLVASAARRARPERAAFAAALVGWNPVVVFHGVGGGHNDAIVGLSLAGAVLLLLDRRELAATAVLVVGALVKAVVAVPLLIMVAAAVASRRSGARMRTLAAHAGIAALAGLPFVIPFFQTEDPTLGQFELAGRAGWLAPSRFVYVSLRGVARWIGGQTGAELISLVVRLAFAALLLAAVVAIIRHVVRAGRRLDPMVVIAGMGWGLLLTLVLSPILLPWYVAWVVPLAWLLPRPARDGVVIVSVALAITEIVAEPSRAPGAWEAMVFALHWIATPLVLLMAVALLADLRRRVRLGPTGGTRDPLLLEDGALWPARLKPWFDVRPRIQRRQPIRRR